MADEDINLNSLSRYSKQSPRMVMEVHGHCEVPAGCGGVVLRWRNRMTAIPCILWIQVYKGSYELYLDGDYHNQARTLLSPGEHVLALKISNFRPAHGIFMFAGIYTEETSSSYVFHHPSRFSAAIRSTADGSWKYTLHKQTDDTWQSPQYDDFAWKPLAEKNMPSPVEEVEEDFRNKEISIPVSSFSDNLNLDEESHKNIADNWIRMIKQSRVANSWYHQIKAFNVEALGITEETGARTIWIRKRFVTPHPDSGGKST